MESILINPKSRSQLKLVTDFLDKMNIPVRILSEEEKEDLGISLLMKEADRNEKVSRETIMQKLKAS